jgi:hypothetical protein
MMAWLIIMQRQSRDQPRIGIVRLLRQPTCLQFWCLTDGVQSMRIPSQLNDCCTAQSARVSRLMAIRQPGIGSLHHNLSLQRAEPLNGALGLFHCE